jgi:hypothetical protein
MSHSRIRSSSGHSFLSLFSISCACLFAASGSRAAMPGDQHWDNQFGYVGASDELFTVNTLGGKLYVGGFLTAAGNTAANFIAGYDGTNWFQLNNGVSGYYNDTYVWALANDGTNLYAGGLFTNADDSGAINIARWDGSSWHPLPGGPPNSLVAAIKIAGTNFFIGGVFTTNGTVPVNCIARWTGTTWQPLGAGLTGVTGFGIFPEAVALEYDGTYLYAGGRFTQAGSVAAVNIARWDGNNWSAMGSGLPGTVLALCSLNGNLYAGGSFTNTSLGITNLACWNGSSWSPVGLGPNNAVQALATDGTNLYAGGFFTNINGIAANRVAKWDGNNWYALGTGIQGFGVNSSPGVLRMALDPQGRLFVAGNFSQAGSVGASHVAGWNGTNWFALGATTSKGLSHSFGEVLGMISDGTNIYAGGTFSEAGGQIADQVARWDGTNWWPMGASTPGVVLKAGPDAFAFAGGDLFAGGYFTNLGPNSVKYVGYWDGTSWDDIGGTDAKVDALAFDGDYLWIGGSFTYVNGNGYTPGLAIYQDGSWYTEGYVSGGNSEVDALGWDGVNFNMYAGGNFTSVNSGSPVSANNIAVFNEISGTWNPLGSGINGTVDVIVVTTNGVAYVGGDFTTAGGVTVNGIAKWNGTTWSALGSGVTGTGAGPSGDPTVNSLVMNGTNLYVGGSFTNAGGVYAQGIAVWNGSTWSSFGSGLYSSAFNTAGFADALVANGNDLYVGGNFTSAGAKPSAFFGHWNSQNDYYPPPHPYLTRESWLPGNQFLFRLAGTSGESYILQASTNFVQWTSLLTNSTTLYDYTDTNAFKFPKRFYRAVLGP